MLTDQQIDEFLEMLSKSPTSARDMVRGLFAAHEAKAAPAVPQGEPVATVVDNFQYPGVSNELDTSLPIGTKVYATPAAPSQSAVPRGIPAQEVIDAIEAWKSAWLKVPPFADRVNKATREAIMISHNSLFLLLQSAQQAQRMPAGCTTPTGCGPHGCHGACIAATPAAPSQERCCTCGYLTSEREHLGCLRKAVKDLDAATGGPYPSQPVNRPQNCGTSFCSCIECVCEPEPVTLTDERLREIDDAHNWQTTEGRMAAHRAIIAALREKEQTK